MYTIYVPTYKSNKTFKVIMKLNLPLVPLAGQEYQRPLEQLASQELLARKSHTCEHPGTLLEYLEFASCAPLPLGIIFSFENILLQNQSFMSQAGQFPLQIFFRY